jgi:peptide/nickel transport system substrate-binding protein
MNGREYLTFNLSNPLFRDKAVRKAPELALDKQGLVNHYRLARANQMIGNYFPRNPFINLSLKPAPYDPEEAKKLLEAAGWKVGPDGIRVKDGKRMAFTLSSTTVPVRVAAAPGMQAYWRVIGAEVNFQAFSPAEYFNTWNQNGILARGRFDVGMFAISESVELDGNYYQYHSSQIPSQAHLGRVAIWGELVTLL